ncbi:MAG TPA: RNA 2',3'-cyclic phosphodiesterase [Syntrophorhabdaceae bacterium]|nr:RNA 2',3'-cyclic phosphodiesterase [Syntrophorhabdaceae bacterium]
MRAFLALELPAEIKEYLAVYTRNLSKSIPQVKWVKPEGQHVTLKFFGEIAEDRAQEIGAALAGLEKNHVSFIVGLNKTGAFPDLKRARVIVVSFQEGVDNAQAIFHDIENRLSTLGIEKEKRPFIPHVTLGRIRVPAPLLRRDMLPLEEKRFFLESLVLYRSTLTREGATYTPLQIIKLERNLE